METRLGRDTAIALRMWGSALRLVVALEVVGLAAGNVIVIVIVVVIVVVEVVVVLAAVKGGAAIVSGNRGIQT